MKRIEVEKTYGPNMEVLNNKVVKVPDNCQYPILVDSFGNPYKCQAPHRNNPECDCRWCVFNREFHKAGE